MDKVNLLIVDDHPLFRQGVVDALSIEQGMNIIGQASNGEDALGMIRSLRPDVAVVDVNLPGMNGQQVTHQVVLEKLPTRIILLTAYDDSEQVLHAALAGAAAYCSKDIEPGRLTDIIRNVANGKYVIDNEVLSAKDFERWLERQLEPSRRSYSEPGSPFHPLSDREMEVLVCVVRGMSNKEIAGLLGISHQTVKNHVTSILRKFGVEDRTQAVVYALKHGWVKLDQQSSNQE
jgi:DNA-binding NarL/FixJ family response regulator